MSRSSVALMLFILALLTAPFASAATGPSKQEVRAMMLRGQALNELYNVAPSTPVTLRGQALSRKYHLGRYADTTNPAIRATMLRGQALNRIYHLGAYAVGPTKDEVRAMMLRGQALNKIYGGGQIAGPSKDEVRALTLRGQALNKIYGGGQYAESTGTSVRWLTVGLAVAAAFGVILVAFAGAIELRRRRTVIAV